MNNISSDEALENLRKIASKYQEIIIHLLNGKITFLPENFLDKEQIETMSAKVIEEFWGHPEKFMQLNIEYTKNFQELIGNITGKFLDNQKESLFTPDSKDRRFKDSAWEQNLFFDFVKQFYIMSSDWLNKAVEQYDLEPNFKRYLEFSTRQFIDALSPSNFIISNPEVLRESFHSSFQNIVKGLDNFLNDVKNSDNNIFNISISNKSKFEIGKNIATTKGKIVLKNELMELICYEPKDNAYSIPILIVPPWINKYYILDLSPDNSLVSFLVEKNFQVFIISWVNPDANLANKNFEDYLKEGIIDSCEYIIKLGYKSINTLGYCIGGTLLATSIAYLKAQNINYINNATFLATLLDFENAGDIGLFINKLSINAIENEVTQKGYFDGKYLANSFSLLRANDLVWSFFVNNYLLGKDPNAFDLLYWNSDSTNLPAKMYIYYLRNMYLDNLLKVPNKLEMLNIAIDLSKIDCPSFFVGAKDDHIAPWQSVYSGVGLVSGDRIFCLTEAGHVAGIIHNPKKHKYSCKITKYSNNMKDSEYLLKAKESKDSWWNIWAIWLMANSGTLEKSINYKKFDYAQMAPGSYVHL